MNIEKLSDEIAKASAAKADNELDRMIKLHEDEAIKYKNAIKFYLQQVGTVVGKATDYAAGNSNMMEWRRNVEACNLLKNLKKELE